MATYHMTDMGNGERFRDTYQKSVRWCKAWKEWLIYSGTYWQKDDLGNIRSFAKVVVQDMHKEAALQKPLFGADRELQKHAYASESNGALTAMLESAKSELKIAPSEMNTGIHLVNCKNGTIDLQKHLLFPHNPDDLITRCINASYDSNATCPQWERFLSSIFAGDTEMVTFMQMALGMGLSGSIEEQKFFICHGTGNNGKSTLLEVVRRIMGSYAAAANVESFMMRRNEGVRNDLAELYGKRFVTASENKLGSRLNEAIVKRITGGEPIRARYLYSNEFEFMPELSLWTALNHKPIIKDTTKSIWRRVVLIPFDVVFEEEHLDPELQVDPKLIEKLLSERDGIFKWLVQGCFQWMAQGHLVLPGSLKTAVATYRDEMNIIATFVQASCVEGTQYKVQAQPLYNAYKRWCEQAGETPETLTAFGLSMKERGYTKGKSMGKVIYHGLALQDDVADIPNDDDLPNAYYQDVAREIKALAQE